MPGDKLLPALAELVGAMKVGPTDVRETQPDMGAVISAEHRARVSGLIDAGEHAGAKVLTDGRKTKVSDAPDGYFLRPTVIDQVAPDNPLMHTEVFGPRPGSPPRQEPSTKRSPWRTSRPSATVPRSSRTPARPPREFRRQVSAAWSASMSACPHRSPTSPSAAGTTPFFGDPTSRQGRRRILHQAQDHHPAWFSFGDGEVWAK